MPWWVLVVVAAAVFGYTQARRSGNVASQAVSAHVDAATGNIGHDPSPDTRTAAARGLPVNLETLDGRAFVDAIPSIEQRARSGDREAARQLFWHLEECVGYSPQDDSEIREAVDNWYERRLAMQKGDPHQPPELIVTEQKRQDELNSRFALRERCSALTPQQVGKRLDWAQWMVAHHDHASIITFAGVGSWKVDNVERVRRAEQLQQFAEVEQAELDRLVDGCDVEALNRLAYSRSLWTPLFSEDAAQAYAFAHAVALVDPAQASQLSYLMSELERDKLSAEQVAQAKATGAALYERCRGVASNASFTGS